MTDGVKRYRGTKDGTTALEWAVLAVGVLSLVFAVGATIENGTQSAAADVDDRIASIDSVNGA